MKLFQGLKKIFETLGCLVIILLYFALLMPDLDKSVGNMLSFFQRPDAIDIFVSEIIEFFQIFVSNSIGFFQVLGIIAGLVVIEFFILCLILLIPKPPPKDKLSLISKEYSVLCHTFEQEKRPLGFVPSDPGEKEVHPLILRLSLTNLGLSLSTHPAQPTWKIYPADNTQRFLRLSSSRPGPIIIPAQAIKLYYTLFLVMGFLPMKMAVKNVYCTGSLPEGNGFQRVKIVITFDTVGVLIKKDFQTTQENSCKLSLVALDGYGQYDLADTRELYDALNKFVTPADDDQDYSWLYRSRPIYW
jgi:hypothetical protein